MKWFEHDCDALHNPKIEVMIDQFGIAAYGIYFGLLELIGKQFESGSDPKEAGFLPINYTLEYLARKKFNCELDYLKNVIDYMAAPTINLIDHDWWVQKQRIYCYKLIERSDRYTKDYAKKQHIIYTPCPDKLHTNYTQTTHKLRSECEENTPTTQHNTTHNMTKRISCERFSQIDHECDDNSSNSNTEQLKEVKEKPKPKPENKPEPTEFIFLAKYLQAGKVRKFGENGKDPTEKDYNRWAKDIRLMITTDKLKYQGECINHDVVKSMIDHVSRTDNQFRVESGRSLREKASKILISMSAPSARASPKQGEAINGIGQIKSGRLN